MAESTATPRHASSFIEAQSVASRRIGFNVTLACPLRCQHCSVKAAPELKRTTFTPAFARRVAAQMPELKAIGVRFVDFTGGEPTLAKAFVKTVSAAATAQGMSCGIVTAAHWAITPQRARTFIDQFPDIANWDLSTDLYHLPFVPREQIRIAFEALVERGRSVQVRIAHHSEISYPEAELIDYVHGFAGRQIGFQPVGPVGRGAELVDAPWVSAAESDPTPCPSTGLLIQNDGAGAPCCAPLSHESRDSPMFVGNAFRDDLAGMVESWRLNPLLQTMRLWGLAPLARWLDESGHSARPFHRRQNCDECVALLGDPVRSRLLYEAASQFERRIDLAVGLQRDFGEPYMDQQLRCEARQFLAAQAGQPLVEA